jgi:protein TonB
MLVARRLPVRSAALAVVAGGVLVLLACGVERPRPDLAEPAPMDAALPAVDEPFRSAEAETPEAPPPAPVAPDVAPPTPADPEQTPPEPAAPPEPNAPSAGLRPSSDARPVFTPMTAPPRLRNVEEVRAALQRLYPSVLRDAGVGGTATVWTFIDERGRVQRAQLQRSSGHAVLDETAVRVSEMMEFTPARNRERDVAVWIQLPIVFDASTGTATPARLGAIDPETMDSLFRTVTFEPAATRPVGYPERLPFVPGTGATIAEFRDGVRAAIFWHDPAANVVERAATLSREEGWMLVSDSTQFVTPDFGIRLVRLQRNGVERQIVAGAGDASMAMLVQGPPEE